MNVEKLNLCSLFRLRKALKWSLMHKEWVIDPKEHGISAGEWAVMCEAMGKSLGFMYTNKTYCITRPSNAESAVYEISHTMRSRALRYIGWIVGVASGIAAIMAAIIG